VRLPGGAGCCLDQHEGRHKGAALDWSSYCLRVRLSADPATPVDYAACGIQPDGSKAVLAGEYSIVNWPVFNPAACPVLMTGSYFLRREKDDSLVHTLEAAAIGLLGLMGITSRDTSSI